MRMKITAALSLLAACLAVATPGATAAPGDHPYIALGDSLVYGYPYGASAADKAFVHLLYDNDYGPGLGADALLNHAQPGATSTQIHGSQLTSSLADINAASDTVAVSLDMGGNDLLSNVCNLNWDGPPCPLRANLADSLSQLKTALDADPGQETFVVTTLYNPGSGGSAEGQYTPQLLGADGVIDCSDSGADIGMDDVIFQEAYKLGIPVADPYPAIKAAGQADIASDHLHPNDAGHAVIAQAFRDATVRCPDPAETQNPPPPPADTDPPQTKIASAPGKTTHKHVATFRFTADEDGSTFMCKLDGGAWQACGGKRTYRHLKTGRHAFRVYATDAAGNRESPAVVKRWRIIPHRP